jgi:hypothetical protein
MTNSSNPVNHQGDWLRREGVPALTPEQAADHVAVESVLNRFCHGLEAKDSRWFAALFAEDGRITLDSDSASGEIAGRARIESWHSERFARLERESLFRRHQVVVPVVNIEGDRAELIAYLTSDAMQFEDSRIHIQMGRYEASFLRTPEGWRIEALRELLFFEYRANEHQYHLNGREALQAAGRA